MLFAYRKAFEARLHKHKANLYRLVERWGGQFRAPRRDSDAFRRALREEPPRPVKAKNKLQAEEGFARLKGTPGLRPHFQQLAHRIEAHLLISELAYHLLTRIRPTLRARGDTRDWKTLLRLLSTHCLATTALPLRDCRVLRIRKPSLPDPEQALAYQKLGIRWKSAFPPVPSFTNP